MSAIKGGQGRDRWELAEYAHILGIVWGIAITAIIVYVVTIVWDWFAGA